uniref:Uncharacterized protein n=1 Tax=Medicago truncatula TaxID=3880 RepID=B7FFQ1_MEDTR|nr:unknown [Medicago truncatula]
MCILKVHYKVYPQKCVWLPQ